MGGFSMNKMLKKYDTTKECGKYTYKLKKQFFFLMSDSKKRLDY